MNANLIVQANKTSQISNVKTVPKLLKNGDSALVRVLADKGNGRYEGVVSGVRVSFSSARPLNVGTSFTATVQLNGNTIVLVPKSEGMVQSESGINTLKFSQLAGFLQELGLIPDSLSAALVQSAKQMEMKMEPSVFAKIRNLALRLEGKSKLAAELALLLLEKGINADEEELEALLSLLNREDLDYSGGESGEKENQAKELLNKANKSEGSWYLLPFNLVENDKNIGGGSFRLLIGHDEKLKLLNVFCKYNECEYFFNLEHSGKKLCRIRFCILKEGNEAVAMGPLLKKILEEKLPGVEVSWAEKDFVEGCASASEELYSFGGQA